MSKPRIQKAPLGVMYVEVNSASFSNIGCYSLTQSAEPLFDIGIIFASNINYDEEEKRAILYHNPNVQRVLDDPEQYIRPLQAKGIKVLLSILGNHEGAGVCNFPNREAARDFALQLALAVEEYGLDGIDFDDEYAEYGIKNTGQPNAYSFIFLLRELRALLPDKIISLYYFGPASSRLTYEGMVAGDFLDYSWNPYYEQYSPPNVPGLERSQLAPAAVNVTHADSSIAQTLARQTIEDEYGVYMYYGLSGSDIQHFLSDISEILYGSGTTLEGGCLKVLSPLDSGTPGGQCHRHFASRGRGGE